MSATKTAKVQRGNLRDGRVNLPLSGDRKQQMDSARDKYAKLKGFPDGKSIVFYKFVDTVLEAGLKAMKLE